MTVTLADIRSAAALIAGTIPETPCIPAPRLSQASGAEVFLKLETVQATGSFKERGALARLLTLTPEAAAAGVIAMSAGNHAQGVACHATRLGIPATIVMPEATPFTKIERTEGYGARVLLHGRTLAEARAYAWEVAERDRLTFVHPYDDPMVVAGQGTVGLEIARQVERLDDVIVPIGGGGLIAGTATAIRALSPRTRIWGVQTALFPAMRQTLAGQAITAGGDTLAEGIAVAEPGQLPARILAGLLEDILLVDEASIERAVHRLIEEQKLVTEGAGAAPVAALLANPDRFRGRRVAIVIGGGNIDDRLLASILMRGLVREGRLIRLRIELNDAPGALSQVARLVADSGGNIVEIYHQRLFFDVPVKRAEVDAVVEIRNFRHADLLAAALTAAGFPTRQMTYTNAGS
ncbi:threonine dehydratase [Stella humosa]|uniref:Threonine dehydratase n=1 Tax=Stella humosa TaxID=94 RepID=A0A3N1MCT1_9PROT|nr:threonine ammonia-lyase [Stella humosa]ROQ01408.1 threonine dehydratase [Stella humosa]BBK31784.1 threonine ammonia-lyase [Stella humosa]